MSLFLYIHTYLSTTLIITESLAVTYLFFFIYVSLKMYECAQINIYMHILKHISNNIYFMEIFQIL